MAVETTIFDYARLAADVRAARDERGLQLKQIAAEAGIDRTKLTNLTKHESRLSIDNLFLVCDWLGTTVDSYRVATPPAWVVERRKRALELAASEAEDRAAMDRRVAANIRGAEKWLRDNTAAPKRTRAHG